MVKKNQGKLYSSEELKFLVDRGVIIPAPDKVAIGAEVPLENIGKGVVLYPFTRIEGEETRIEEGAEIGPGGAATLQNSRIGRDAVIGKLGPVTLIDVACGEGVILGCGVAEEAVFLERDGEEPAFTTGYGFRVRKGSLYEEGANSAQHTDTKMTILFPWVTLGSNINWCDVLVAGGTGGGLGEFTEVGSGSVHFNFTPRGDKTTASSFGNAVEGVFLDRNRLFIGGNGSLLGPIQTEFGMVTGAGGRYAGKLLAGLNTKAPPHATGRIEDFSMEIYGSVKRLFDTQITFIGELVALEAWYAQARALVAAGDPSRTALYQAGGGIVRLNLEERIAQIARLAGRMDHSAGLLEQEKPGDLRIGQHRALSENWPDIEKTLRSHLGEQEKMPEELRQGLEEGASQEEKTYTRIVGSLPTPAVAAGRKWMREIKDRVAAPNLLEKVPKLRSSL